MQEARRQQMKKAANAQNPGQPGQGPPGPGMPQGGPPIDPRTGLPVGMDPRMLLTMDPRNPPPGVDPRIIQQIQAAHAQRLREAEQEEDDDEDEDE